MTRIVAGLVLASVLAACGAEDVEPTSDPGLLASVPDGGLLYDKFWKASDTGEPTGDHPLWATRPDPSANARSGSTTWRCKECHGWDYRGVDGAYAEGSHRTGFPGVLGSKRTVDELITLIGDVHGFRSAGLSDVDLESLALFIREGLIDTSTWIDAEGAFRGDAERGKTLYLEGLGGSKSCSTCHGEDGLAPPKKGDTEYEDFVGRIALENPWEFLHKVRFGQPGTKMPAAIHAGASMQDLADLSAHSQTLPKDK